MSSLVIIRTNVVSKANCMCLSSNTPFCKQGWWIWRDFVRHTNWQYISKKREETVVSWIIQLSLYTKGEIRLATPVAMPNLVFSRLLHESLARETEMQAVQMCQRKVIRDVPQLSDDEGPKFSVRETLYRPKSTCTKLFGVLSVLLSCLISWNQMFSVQLTLHLWRLLSALSYLLTVLKAVLLHTQWKIS